MTPYLILLACVSKSSIEDSDASITKPISMFQMKKKNKTPNVSKQSAKREAKKEKAKAKEAKKKTKNEKQKEKIKKKVAAIRSMDLSEFAQTEQEDSSSSDEYLGSPDTPNEQRLPGVLQVSRASEKKVLPGALLTPPPLPNCYTERILQEERPDLAENGRFKMEEMTTTLSQNEDDRCCSRYEIQLKYNEGRYSSIYIVSKKVFGNRSKEDNGTDAANLFALKTGIRNGSANLSIRMKRELRILATMKKAKASWAPILLDSGSVCDMPFIVTNLVDMNIEKLREMIGGKFKPSSAFYIAGEVLNALVVSVLFI
uniref:Tub domain-containing protein n=1 Tax=Angiostrongylus cantonensis TaxID=6313 RepID=A0A0K0CT07_ANGCA